MKTKNIINESIKSWVKEDAFNTLVGTAVTVYFAAIAAAIIALGVKVYKHLFTEVGRKCRGLTGREFDKCKLRVTINAREKQIQTMKSKISRCDKSNDPKKCKEKVNNKIKEINDKVIKLKKQLDEMNKLEGK